MTVPLEVYDRLSRGDMSEEQVSGLEEFDSMLKSAGIRTGWDVAREWAPAAVSLAAIPISAATGLATGIGGHIIGDLTSTAYEDVKNRVTYPRDLARIQEVYPNIAKDYPEKDVNLAYGAIRALNPTYAKEPLVGGSLLKQILMERDPMDPKAPPRLGLQQASVLSGAYRPSPNELQRTVSKSLQDSVRGSEDRLFKSLQTMEERSFDLGPRGDREFRKAQSRVDRDFKETQQILAEDAKNELEELKNTLSAAREKAKDNRAMEAKVYQGSGALERDTRRFQRSQGIPENIGLIGGRDTAAKPPKL